MATPTIDPDVFAKRHMELIAEVYQLRARRAAGLELYEKLRARMQNLTEIAQKAREWAGAERSADREVRLVKLVKGILDD